MKPGPGQYPAYPGISKSGVYFLSKFKSSMCRTFGARYLDHAFGGAPSQTPGPGSYRVPSEFGEYTAQDKYIKETERTEERRRSRMTSRMHRKSESQAALGHSTSKPSSQPAANQTVAVAPKDPPTAPPKDQAKPIEEKPNDKLNEKTKEKVA